MVSPVRENIFKYFPKTNYAAPLAAERTAAPVGQPPISCASSSILASIRRFDLAPAFSQDLQYLQEIPEYEERFARVDQAATTEQEHFALLWALVRMHNYPSESEQSILPPILIRAGVYTAEEAKDKLTTLGDPSSQLRNWLLIAQRINSNLISVDSVLPYLASVDSRVSACAWGFITERGNPSFLPEVKARLSSSFEDQKRAISFIARHGSLTDVADIEAAAAAFPELSNSAEQAILRLRGELPTPHNMNHTVAQKDHDRAFAGSEAEALELIKSDKWQKRNVGFAYFAEHLDFQNANPAVIAAFETATPPEWVRSYLLMRLLKLDTAGFGVIDRTIPDYFGYCSNTGTYFQTTARVRQYTLVNDGFFYKPSTRGFQIALYIGKNNPAAGLYFGGIYQPSGEDIDRIEYSGQSRLDLPASRWNYLRDTDADQVDLMAILLETNLNNQIDD